MQSTWGDRKLQQFNFSNLESRLDIYNLITLMFDYSNLLASRKMTLLPSVRVRISPSLVISSLPLIWSVMTKLLILPPVTVSQTQTVLSSLKLTNCLLPGVYITCLMPPMRPSNLMIGSLGCSRSNILTTNHNIYYLFPQNITKLPGNLIVTTAPVARAALLTMAIC